MNHFKKTFAFTTSEKVTFLGALFFFFLAAISNAKADCNEGSVDWAQAKTVNVTLERFRFYPNYLSFVACKPYKLHIVNNSAGIGHSFSAPDFLKSVKIRNPDSGKMNTPTFESVDLVAQTDLNFQILPEATGDFPLWCSHKFHAHLGMKGWIHVSAQ